MILPWIYYGLLPSIEDENRYGAPPEPSQAHWPEPEDHCDYIDTLSEEPTTDTP